MSRLSMPLCPQGNPLASIDANYGKIIAMERRQGERRFLPQEVLFSSTTNCNLNCRHCSGSRDRKELKSRAAIRFLESCKEIGLERIGFTGGEPFLSPGFLCSVSSYAVKNDFLFDRITTNAVWFSRGDQLKDTLKKLYESGYDGSFAVSVDFFHKDHSERVGQFIKAAVKIWNRPDIVEILSVKGVSESQTKAILKKLAKALHGKIVTINSRRFIVSDSLNIHLKTIDLVPVGRAAQLASPWGKEWFKEDYCWGPGHVFFVLPDGSVKPCCGYATDADRLTIGNIHKDTAARILENAWRNRFVAAIYERGLSRIRRGLIEQGVVFPGETKNHCYFCHYILTEIPGSSLDKCL